MYSCRHVFMCPYMGFLLSSLHIAIFVPLLVDPLDCIQRHRCHRSIWALFFCWHFSSAGIICLRQLCHLDVIVPHIPNHISTYTEHNDATRFLFIWESMQQPQTRRRTGTGTTFACRCSTICWWTGGDLDPSHNIGRVSLSLA